jgi:hypothetical protein
VREEFVVAEGKVARPASGNQERLQNPPEEAKDGDVSIITNPD